MHACTGERNGNPLQHSCLENPRDRGASWAAVCGVAQSRTQLKRLSSSSSPPLKCHCLREAFHQQPLQVFIIPSFYSLLHLSHKMIKLIFIYVFSVCLLKIEHKLYRKRGFVCFIFCSTSFLKNKIFWNIDLYICCCAGSASLCGLSSSCGWWELFYSCGALSLIAAVSLVQHRLLGGWASVAEACRLTSGGSQAPEHRLSSCGTWA